MSHQTWRAIMTNTLKAALVAAALGLLPGAASAESAMKDDHMMMPHPATMICRAAASGEKGNAMMAADRKPLLCKDVSAMMHDGKISGPDLSKSLPADQVNAAWQAWLAAQFAVS